MAENFYQCCCSLISFMFLVHSLLASFFNIFIPPFWSILGLILVTARILVAQKHVHGNGFHYDIQNEALA
jgi:hypothetical protein